MHLRKGLERWLRSLSSIVMGMLLVQPHLTLGFRCPYFPLWNIGEENVLFTSLCLPASMEGECGRAIYVARCWNVQYWPFWAFSPNLFRFLKGALHALVHTAHDSSAGKMPILDPEVPARLWGKHWPWKCPDFSVKKHWLIFRSEQHMLSLRKPFSVSIKCVKL